MKKMTVVILTSLLLAFTSACGSASKSATETKETASAASEDKHIKLVMGDSGFATQIIATLKEELANDGFTLEHVISRDIIEPNKLVSDGRADANFMQTQAYLDEFIAGTKIKNLQRAFYVGFLPVGLYSNKYKTIEEVPDGATFAIPIDTSNVGRPLHLLQKLGVLKLKEGKKPESTTVQDIVENPHNYKFKEVDQLMLPQTLNDVDVTMLGVTTVALQGKDPNDAIAIEEYSPELPFILIVAANTGVIGTPKIKALEKAFESDKIKAFFDENYKKTLRFTFDLNKK
ncbi:MetQ/NlpA family ABC transporter substrate-binding protein [Paenibacillus sp. GCM10012307]|uniref:Lipoprotein n=1 Tax=Paenibacillus roseus TaxID=2798579 RepID=A0A934MP53_9BACL|nr:MetQ/NlpA family ABC transporter substrate-binding protein [Paenibacillus roseus]MBJ6360533.1 hypothetical protein [Paenibacillus roseus]